MSDVTVPHFRFPFNIGALGYADVVEQDTLDEIAQGVQVVLMTIRGERLEIPSYGITDLVFKVAMPWTEVLADIGRWEPRATVAFTDQPDALDDLIRDVVATVKQGGQV